MRNKILVFTIIVVVIVVMAVIFWPRKKPQSTGAYGDTAAEENNPANIGNTAVAESIKNAPDVKNIISAPNAATPFLSGLASIFGFKMPSPAPTEVTKSNLSTADFLDKYFPGVLPKISPDLANKFPLKRGSKGAEVQYLQFFLNADIIANKRKQAQLKIDGSFGPATETALKNMGLGNQITIEQYSNVVLPFVNKYLKK